MNRCASLLLLLLMAATARAQDSCPSDCIVMGDQGNVYDLSKLKGMTFTTVGDGGVSYSFTMCGQDSTMCPSDDANVTIGMAVQTSGTEECFILGVYDSDQTCTWQESEPGSASVLSLILHNGSPVDCGGTDRGLAIKFNCPDDTSQLFPQSWTARNPEGTCDYAFQFDTCAVCPGGCTGASPTPGSSGGGAGFGFWFLIVCFAGVFPLYIGMSAGYNYMVKGSRGVEVLKIHPGFWSAFCTNVKAGVVFVMSCGKSVPEDNGVLYDDAALCDTSVSYQEQGSDFKSQPSSQPNYF